MKFSIITPTHKTKYLKELEETILKQEYTDWEWIILLNNGAKYTSIDERIKVYKSRKQTTFVGALKKEACSFASGDVIVEVDHDDLITPDCLSELYKAYSEDSEVGFVYSDNAKLSKDFIPYNPHYGWEWYTYEWQGEKYKAMRSQPLNAGRLGYIWFAPDHVRSWKRDVYNSIGGHNEKLEICDDQDLMHRLYLVTKFGYIPKVLYMYRIDGENTWLKKNQDIQTNTVSIYNKNIYSLAERWADINGLMKIDLCGGFNKPNGYTSIDMYNGDIIADLEKGIPLPDNSVGVVRAHDALEHVKDSMLLMKEIHRVLAKGGMLLSFTPSTDGRGAWQDPTHISFWNQNSFFYWTRPDIAKYIHNDKWLFRECALYTHFPSKWHEENNVSYVIAHLEKL